MPFLGGTRETHAGFRYKSPMATDAIGICRELPPNLQANFYTVQEKYIFILKSCDDVKGRWTRHYIS